MAAAMSAYPPLLRKSLEPLHLAAALRQQLGWRWIQEMLRQRLSLAAHSTEGGRRVPTAGERMQTLAQTQLSPNPHPQLSLQEKVGEAGQEEPFGEQAILPSMGGAERR